VKVHAIFKGASKVKVEITIRVLGEENESAEVLLGRVASLLRDQPSVLVETVGAKGETIAVKASKEEDEDTLNVKAEAASGKKRGRKSNAEKAAEAAAAEKSSSKKKKAEPEPEEDEEEFDDIDIEGDEEDESEEDEGEDEEPEEKPAKSKGKAKDKKGSGLTLEGDIIPAFRKFTGAHGNSAGADVMKQFGVQSVRDLDEGDYPAVLEAIASYKPKKKK
jgi:hypothetical protein